MRVLQAVQRLLEMQAIEEVPVLERGSELYSLLFTVPKRNGKWRAVLDLSSSTSLLPRNVSEWRRYAT